METSASRIEPGRVIGEAFQTYRDQVSAILGGALIVIGITSVINNLLGLTDSVILIFAGLIVALIGQVLYTGYVVKLVQDVRDGRRNHTMDELFSAAAPYVSTLILNGFVYGVAVFFGFLALIVPGLILITIWAVVAPCIVVEDKGVFEAFGRSRELVRGNGWRVFGTIVLAFLIVVVVAGVFGVTGASIGDAGRVILGTIGNVLVVPVEALVAGILFFDLGGGRGRASTTRPSAEEPGV
ncbi:MAG TPA: YciC family protein [Solirubrobacterales bacterium]